MKYVFHILEPMNEEINAKKSSSQLRPFRYRCNALTHDIELGLVGVKPAIFFLLSPRCRIPEGADRGKGGSDETIVETHLLKKSILQESLFFLPKFCVQQVNEQ